MNYYRNMDSSQFHIDFSSYNDPDDKTLKEIEQKTGTIISCLFAGKILYLITMLLKNYVEDMM